MIKKYLLHLFCLLILSCGIKPPSSLESTPFLQRLESISTEIGELLNDFSMTNMMKPTWSKGAIILQASENDKIIFEQLDAKKSDINNKTIAFASKNGFIEIAKNIYFSKNRKESIIYSFDLKNWFALYGDPREYENFVPDVSLIYKNDGETLKYSFSWRLQQGTNPKIADGYSRMKIPLKDREVVQYGATSILYSTDESAEQLNLKEKILLVPKGALVKLNFEVEGNIFNFERLSSNSVKFNFKTPIWIYRNNFIFSVSFDGVDYSNTIFSFDYDFKMFVRTDDKISPEVIYKIKFLSNNI